MYIQDEGPKSPLYTRMSIELLGYEYLEQATDNSAQRVTLNTTRGPIEGIYHEPMHSESFAVVWASGARGGFDGPSNAIYADLAEYFAESNIASFRVNYRHPANLDESTLDILVAVWHMANLGFSKVALVGHSFGGGVVLSVSRYTTHVRAVAVLASQTDGAEEAVLLNGRPILVVHGEADAVLPVANAQTIYDWSSNPKELVTFPQGGHGLRECPEELRTLLKDWIVKVLI